MGIYVSSQAFLAKSVQLQLESDGASLGGEIHISSGVCISDGVILAAYGGSIYLEENVFIGPYSVLYGHGGLRIGKDTLIAGQAFIVPSNHEFSNINQPIRAQGEKNIGISIGKDNWIGCNVKVLDGVSTGVGCVIGAGSVVNKSFDDLSVAVGVPAKVIKKRGA